MKLSTHHLLKSRMLLLFASLFLISSSILMSQVLVARESRVAFGFSLEFIIFSFAIAGIGLGGLFVYFFSKNKSQEQINKLLLFLFPVFALLTIAPFGFLHIVNMYTSPFLNVSLDLLLFLSSFAFYFVGGVLIAAILKYHPERVSKLYFFDLLGAAFGSLVVIGLMDSLGTANTVLFIYAVSAGAAILYFLYQGKNKISLLLLSVPLVLPPFLAPTSYFQVTCRPEQAPLLVDSNSFSQVNIDKINSVDIAISKEVIGTNYVKNASNFELFNLSRDCKPSAAYILKFKDLSDVKFLLSSINNLPYLLRDYTNVLEIGSGPGNWVLIGVLNRAPNITAVEINPLVISSFGKVVDYNVYRHPTVNLQIEEGRNFLAKSSQKYDLIFLFTKTYGGVGTAAYAFSENYLFTKEAYNAYLDHLSNDGVLAIADANWFASKSIETLVPTLEERGLDPQNHLIVAKGRNYSISMISKNRFSYEEQSKITNLSTKLGFSVENIADAGATRNLANFIPATDDKPFLWNIADLKKSLDNTGKPSNIPQESEQSSLTFGYLLMLLVLTSVSYLLFIVLPFKLRKVGATSNAIYLSAFFTFIAIGFITFELGLVQKLTLFLAKPQFSISVTLFSILFFGGIGSLVTQKIKSRELRSWATKTITAFLLMSLFYLLLADFLFPNLSALSDFSRIMLVAIGLSVPSFLIGMIFPIGLKMTNIVSAELIPWMFGVDGVASVLGGVVSKITFLTFGFRVEFMIVFLMYFLALITLFKIKLNQKQIIQ